MDGQRFRLGIIVFSCSTGRLVRLLSEMGARFFRECYGSRPRGNFIVAPPPGLRRSRTSVKSSPVSVRRGPRLSEIGFARR